jgi:hypothetical protein
MGSNPIRPTTLFEFGAISKLISVLVIIITTQIAPAYNANFQNGTIEEKRQAHELVGNILGERLRTKGLW